LISACMVNAQTRLMCSRSNGVAMFLGRTLPFSSRGRSESRWTICEECLFFHHVGWRYKHRSPTRSRLLFEYHGRSSVGCNCCNDNPHGQHSVFLAISSTAGAIGRLLLPGHCLFLFVAILSKILHWRLSQKDSSFPLRSKAQRLHLRQAGAASRVPLSD